MAAARSAPNNRKRRSISHQVLTDTPDPTMVNHQAELQNDLQSQILQNLSGTASIQEIMATQPADVYFWFIYTENYKNKHICQSFSKASLVDLYHYSG